MQAPTDSLYKFIAISGLIGLIFIDFDYNRRFDELTAKTYEDEAKTAELGATVSSYRTRKEYLEREIAGLKDNEGVRRERLEKYYDEHMVKFQDFEVSIVRLKKSIDVGRGRAQDLKFLLKSYTAYKLILAGLFMAGLFLWYYKLQVYVDAKEKSSIDSSPAKALKLRDRLPRRNK